MWLLIFLGFTLTGYIAEKYTSRVYDELHKRLYKWINEWVFVKIILNCGN